MNMLEAIIDALDQHMPHTDTREDLAQNIYQAINASARASSDPLAAARDRIALQSSRISELERMLSQAIAEAHAANEHEARATRANFALMEKISQLEGRERTAEGISA